MKKRLLTVALAAATTVLATPGVSNAIVTNDPKPDFPEFNGIVKTIIHRGNVVYVGGSFKRVIVDGRAVARPGAAAFNRLTGDLLPWKPLVAGTVNDMAWSREGIYLVGQFRKVKRQPRKNVALVTAAGVGRLKPLNVKTVGAVNTVGLDARKVYLGGGFTKVAGQPRGRLAAFSRTNGKVIKKWKPTASLGPVMDLRVTKAGVYAGGYFKGINGRTAFGRLALLKRTNGLPVTTFTSKTRFPVVSVAVSGSTVYAGLGGRLGGGLRAVNRATGAEVFHRRLDGDVQAVLVLAGTIYAGGHFNNVCNEGAIQQPTGDCEVVDRVQRLRGASFDAAGTLTAWDPRANTELGIMALDSYAAGETLIAGGDFTELKNNPVRRLAVYGP